MINLIFEKNNSNNEKEINDVINKNIASAMKTQKPFGQLLLLNGCSNMKLGYVGSKIRKQLLKEAKNGDLTVEDVMPRAYDLIGEFLDISDVKTFEDMAIENTNEALVVKGNENRDALSQKADDKKLIKQNKLEEKFGISLTGKQWFKCSIEEVKYSTFTNQPVRNFDNAYVIINEDNIEIFKESVWLKSNMGSRKLYFYNITSIDFDARGKLHASSSAIINTKSAEHVQLKFVTKENFDLMNNAFESYLEKTHNPQQTAPMQQNIPTASAADELLKYAELYEKGFLTKEEFDLKKAELLGGESIIVEQSNSTDEIPPIEEQIIKFCPNCGSEVGKGSNFCSSCGSKL